MAEQKKKTGKGPPLGGYYANFWQKIQGIFPFAML